MKEYNRRRSIRRLGAQTRSVGEVLSSAHVYAVPYFQRLYSWDPEDAWLLLDDIRRAQADVADRLDVSMPYFLGSLVVSCATGDDTRSIIDGQQRLTTLTMILCIMRDLDEDGGARLGGFILRPDDPDGDQRAVMVKQRPIDLRFFFDNFQTMGATTELSEEILVDNDAQARMVQAGLALRTELEKMSPASRNWLADFILRSCDFVEITAPDNDQAFQVFTSINARGKDFNEKDLLKAEVIGSVLSPRRARFAFEWESLEASLGDEHFNELFHHITMIHSPTKTNRSAAIRLRESIDPASSPESFILDELVPKGNAMLDLLSGTVIPVGAHVDRSKQLLGSLLRINNRDWLSVAIAYFSRSRRRGDEAETFLAELERQAYMILFQAGDENLRWARYSKVVRAIQENQPTEVLVKTLDATNQDRLMSRKVLDGNIYRKEHLRTAVLLRIDEFLSGGVAQYDLPNVSVEHVLPQNPPPGSPWLESFPYPEFRRRWVDRLGNLALLDRKINENAGNFDFERKKSEYFQHKKSTPFVITSQIIAEPVWTPAVIEQRHKLLLDAACEIWRI